MQGYARRKRVRAFKRAKGHVAARFLFCLRCGGNVYLLFLACYRLSGKLICFIAGRYACQLRVQATTTNKTERIPKKPFVGFSPIGQPGVRRRKKTICGLRVAARCGLFISFVSSVALEIAA